MRLLSKQILLALTVLCVLCGLVISALLPRDGARAMTVEEARKITSADKKPSYAPPPRTIDDITKVLAQNRPDPKKIEQLRVTADQPVPAGLSGMALADFYNKRGLAARDLGRTQQRLADLREAWKLAKSTALAPTAGPGSKGSGGGDLNTMTPQERGDALPAQIGDTA